jgi:chromosome partitioning protein
MTHTISVMNHKGGVGKTTSTTNIGAGLHLLGQRVLLIDLDPQANLTMHLFGDPEAGKETIYGALRSEYGLPVITLKPGLDLVISTLDLSAAELELQSEPGREYILHELISPYRNDYDYILIDCPPSLGLLTINALSTSTEIIIPVESSAFSLKGMTKLFDIIEKVKYRLNKNLKSYKILITKYDSRKSIQKQITERIQSQKLAPVFKTIIRTTVTLEEAGMSQCSVFEVDQRCAGAIDYMNVCKEVINKNRQIEG